MNIGDTFWLEPQNTQIEGGAIDLAR